MSSFDSVYSPDIIQNYAKHFTPELPELDEGAMNRRSEGAMSRRGEWVKRQAPLKYKSMVASTSSATIHLTLFILPACFQLRGAFLPVSADHELIQEYAVGKSNIGFL